MPWNKTEPMNERIKFIAIYLEGERGFSDLCQEFGVSRKTGYKWVERYEEGGPQGLLDRSRAPLAHSHSVSEDVVKEILKVRTKHPNWGPRKLVIILKRQRPNLILPVASTIGEILKRHGMISKRKRRRLSSPYGNHLGNYAGPNAIWCADFKGHFPVGGKRCHPLTISDGFSRYLLRCNALRRPLSDLAKNIFESAFYEYGLPRSIRTDNGAPFSTLAPGGLSRLAIWWIKLGIIPERIMPGHPEQNGRHERMHQTLKAETAKPPRSSFVQQQKAIDDFREEYNNVRPHEALDQEVPALFYKPSEKPYPRKLPEIEYPDHFHVAQAYPNGVITFLSTQWYVSACLKNELVGLEEADNDRWKVYFGHVLLGMIDLQYAKERKDRQFGTIIRFDGQINGGFAKKNRKPK